MELEEKGLFGVGGEGPLWSWKRRASLELGEKGLFGEGLFGVGGEGSHYSQERGFLGVGRLEGSLRSLGKRKSIGAEAYFFRGFL